MKQLTDARKKAQTGNVAEQVWGILTLARLQDRDSLPIIRARLQADDSGVRWAAVNALSDLNDFESVRSIRVLLVDSSRWVRVASVIALTSLQKERVIEELLSLLEDNDELVALYAIYGLADVGNTKTVENRLTFYTNDERRVWASRGETIGFAARYALDCVRTRLAMVDVAQRQPSASDFDSMTPDEMIAWMEGLAARQGATEGFTSEGRIDSQEMDTDPVEINDDFIPYGKPPESLTEQVDESADDVDEVFAEPNGALAVDIDDIRDVWVEAFELERQMQQQGLDEITEEWLKGDLPASEVVQIPDWLREQQDSFSEEMPEWLAETGMETEDVPNWLLESISSAETVDVPDWLLESSPSVRVASEALNNSIFDSPLTSPTDVMFSAYMPPEAVTKVRHSMIVYAHTEQHRVDVEHDAVKHKDEFGGVVPKPKQAKKTATLELGVSITIVPECDELEFEPERLTKKWHGDWTRFGFEFRPTEELLNESLFVRVSIQVAGIEIAHIKSAIEVVEAKKSDLQNKVLASNPLLSSKMRSQTVTPYQRIFISYSRQDTNIAKSFKIAQTALGNEAFLDVDNLRTGEDWQAALARAIDNADIFQLFWSEHSASSEYCRYEWDYALTVRCSDENCEGFIRPVYWRKPMPSPPPELSRINFRFVPFEDQDD